MRNKRVLFLILFYYCLCYVFSKRFETRCKLVRELLKVGVPNDLFLGQWVCLIEKASNRNTSAYVVTPSGKKFYGLYQLPSKWCKENKRGGDCNMKCEDLLDEDIRDDTTCATKIYQEEGFKYWPVWTARCKNDNFITNEIYKCPDLRFSPDRTNSPLIFKEQTLYSRFKRSIVRFANVPRLKYLSRHID